MLQDFFNVDSWDLDFRVNCGDTTLGNLGTTTKNVPKPVAKLFVTTILNILKLPFIIVNIAF